MDQGRSMFWWKWQGLGHRHPSPQYLGMPGNVDVWGEMEKCRLGAQGLPPDLCILPGVCGSPTSPHVLFSHLFSYFPYPMWLHYFEFDTLLHSAAVCVWVGGGGGAGVAGEVCLNKGLVPPLPWIAEVRPRIIWNQLLPYSAAESRQALFLFCTCTR